jgi:hypothetical protein
MARFLNWVSGFLASLPQRLAALWPSRRPKLFHTASVEDFPERLEPFRLYLAGEPGKFWAAAMICPCGCGEIIELNLLPQARPCWKAQEHADGTVTLAPSVWRRKGCRSHFMLTRGRISWF